MTRSNDGDDEGEGIPWELYQRAFDRHIRSRVGRPMLLAFEEALVGMPAKRLTHGVLCREGEVCAVGAYVAHRRVAKGEDRATVLADLDSRSRKFYSYKQDLIYDDFDYDAWSDTIDAGKAAGLSKMLATAIEDANDELGSNATPERRYDHVLAEVRRLIARSTEPDPWPRKAKPASAQLL